MLCYCFTPYQRLWLYNGAPLVAFFDTLGIRRTYSRLKPPASSRGRVAKIKTAIIYSNRNSKVGSFEIAKIKIVKIISHTFTIKSRKFPAIRRYNDTLNTRTRGERRWPSGLALGLRSKRSGVRFPASPLEFQKLVISCFKVAIWLKYR